MLGLYEPKGTIHFNVMYKGGASSAQKKTANEVYGTCRFREGRCVAWGIA